MAGKTLAAGTREGLCLWSVDTLASLQPLASRMNGVASSESAVPLMNVLKFPGQTPVTTLSWDPTGQ